MMLRSSLFLIVMVVVPTILFAQEYEEYIGRWVNYGDNSACSTQLTYGDFHDQPFVVDFAVDYQVKAEIIELDIFFIKIITTKGAVIEKIVLE